ncbi:MAG TPA: hypothetical protein PKN32_00880 [Bacteroidales bacterium]|nr:hypothetical protein [Bacteroidales bacterium]
MEIIKKYCCCLLMFAFCLTSANAQYLENNPTTAKRIFFGGDVGLSFGSVTFISVNPIIGYRVSNRLSMGTGINYTYANSSYYNYEGSMYGGNVFASYTIIKNLGEVLNAYQGSGILLYAEYSAINISNYYDFPGTSIKWIGTPLAGFAFQTPIGKKSYMLIMVLYNFNECSMSPYSNPVFRMSMQF